MSGADPVQAAVTLLLADATLAGLVGTNIRPLIRAQEISTATVTLTPITTLPQNHFQGDGNLDVTRMQVDSWAPTYGAARAIANQCRAVFLAANVLMLIDAPAFEESPIPGLYRVTQEFEVWT